MARESFFKESLHRTKAQLLASDQSLWADIAKREFRSFQYQMPSVDSYCVNNGTASMFDTDTVAKEIYPEDGPSNLVPVQVCGDGNCLFRSASKLVFGDEVHHVEMRVRTIIELLCYSEYYLSSLPFRERDAGILQWVAAFSAPNTMTNLNFTHFECQKRVFFVNVLASCTLCSWAGFWHIVALSSVLKMQITSIYPSEKVHISHDANVRKVLNRTIYPRESSTENACAIMWTNMGRFVSGMWCPNHFVPCFRSDAGIGCSFELPKSKKRTPRPKRKGAMQSTDRKTKKQKQMTLDNWLSENHGPECKGAAKCSGSERDGGGTTDGSAERRGDSGDSCRGDGDARQPRTVRDPKLPQTSKIKSLQTDKCISKFSSTFKEMTSDLYFCAICSKLHLKDQIHVLPDLPASFPEVMNIHRDSSSVMCSRCARYVKKSKLPPYSRFNEMETGIVPEALQSLTFMEKRFISQVHAFLTVISLPAGGQYAETGLCINLPVDLKLNVNMLGKTNVVICKSEKDRTTIISGDNIVRKTAVDKALEYLASVNEHYKSIDTHLAKGEVQDDQSKGCEKENTEQIHCETKECESNAQYDGALGNSICFTPVDNVPSKRSETESMRELVLPRLNTKPLSLFDSNAEILAYPWLFPLGKNGLNTARDPKLTDLDYVKNRLLSKDSRWRKDPSYLFWILNVYEIRKLQSCISIALRKRKLHEVQKDRKLLHPEVLNSAFTFMRDIRGTAGYWKKVLFDLLAKFRTLGPPTWFLTLSAADLQWNDLKEFLLMDNDNANINTKQSNVALVRANPVLTSIHFRKRWQLFFREIILKGKVVGEVTDYFSRVEFQSRGSPHLHIFLWIKDAPDVRKLNGKLALPPFLDRYISTKIPLVEGKLRELVKSLQIHSHTHTCKKGRMSCRFKFPRPVCEKTRLKEFNNIDQCKSIYETERTKHDVYVNAFNPQILLAWEANMDLQYISSIYGVAAYVCSYICKAEPQVLRDAVSEVINKIQSTPGLTNRKQLSKLGMTLLSKREVGAPEAAFRLVGLPLVDSSRASIYVNCRPPDKRIRIIKAREVSDEMPVDNLEEIFFDGLPELYAARPKTLLFENMSLAYFATHFSTTNETLDTLECAKTSRKLPRYQLLNKRVIRQRQKAACLRLPYLTYLNDGDDYYYMFLFLYLPWRSESELISPCISAKEALCKKYQHLDQTSYASAEFAWELERAVQQIRMNEGDGVNDLVATLLPNVCHAEENDAANVCSRESWQLSLETGRTDTEEMENNSGDLGSKDLPVSDDHLWRTLSLYTMTEKEFAEKLSSLNEEQKGIFETVRSYSRKRYMNDKSTDVEEPLRMFVSGPGGCGKSYLISLIYEYLLRDNSEAIVSVIKVAPTGVAAHNIGGITLHRALFLPVQKRGDKFEHNKLGGERLAELRKQYTHVHTIIIDEISMVSYKMFRSIHLRLCEIKDNDDAFGGMSILAFGDFYQLKPVCESYLFQQSPWQRVVHLWNDLFEVKLLTENVRQKEEMFANMLKRARIGKLLPTDELLLQSRIGIHTCSTGTNSYFSDALRIYPTKKQCKAYNNSRVHNLITKTKVNLVCVSAINELLNKTKYPQASTQEEYEEMCLPDDDTKCGGFPSDLHIAIGVRVMLLRNLDVSQNLVNGSMGTVQQICVDENNPMPLNVVVNFDGKETCIEIEPKTIKFFGKLNSVWQRTQLPLQVAYACTVHKVQGLTLNKAVINVGDRIFDAGMAYVALSRVRNLESLSLEELNTHKIYASAKVEEYYKNHHQC